MKRVKIASTWMAAVHLQSGYLGYLNLRSVRRLTDVGVALSSVFGGVVVVVLLGLGFSSLGLGLLGLGIVLLLLFGHLHLT